MQPRRKSKRPAASSPAQPPAPKGPPAQPAPRTGEGSSSALEALRLQRRTRPGELLPTPPERKKPAG